MKSDFNYESKLFGIGDIKTLPWYIPALKLKYSLQSLKTTKGRILDVGCGGGAMAKAIKSYRKDLEIVGCDISDKALSYAAKANTKQIRFIKGSAYKLPFRDNYFDAVVCFDVLEHLQYPNKAVTEINRVLKKGGIFHIVSPCEGSLYNIEGWMVRFGWRAKKIYCGHIKTFSLVSLDMMITERNFRMIDKIYSGHLFSQIIDAAYFSMLQIRGKNVLYPIEGYIKLNKGVQRNLILAIRTVIAIVSYLESSLLFFLPGLEAHYVYEKKD